MKFTTFATFLALTSGSLAAPAGEALEKRNPTGSFSLIAYGAASSYIKIFYSDGRSSEFQAWIDYLNI